MIGVGSASPSCVTVEAAVDEEEDIDALLFEVPVSDCGLMKNTAAAITIATMMRNAIMRFALQPRRLRELCLGLRVL